jgi:hypothetical protein
VVALTALCLVASCTGATSPADAVPELRAMVSQVDRAIVDGRHAQARMLLDGLVDATIAARDDGELDAARADRILAAAAELLAALPRTQANVDVNGATAHLARASGGDPVIAPQSDQRREEPGADLGTADAGPEASKVQATKVGKKPKRDDKIKNRERKARGRAQGGH